MNDIQPEGRDGAGPATMTVRPGFSWAGVLLGMRMVMPFVPGILTFATVYGAAAAAKGLTLGQTLAMSGIVYAGLSQMVVLQIWTENWTLASLGTIAILTAAINARMILMGASLQPWLKHAPVPLNAVNLFLFTDQSWVIGLRHYESGGRDFGVLLGVGLLTWPLWVMAAVPGFLAGAAMGDPARFGLDLVIPIMFAIMLVPLWRGARPAVPWAVGGLVALIVSEIGGGYLYIVAGAVAGGLAGAFLPEKADA